MLAYHWHSPPPPPIPHKVWILDCSSCATFLTNRAMKAVLLLRPNVSLFSSDALPTNCSPYTTNPVALRPRSQSSAPHPSRTCECLTQTLCCHGCGGTIGYMIVIPCTRCTSSITATNRATNGHRFVFHSSQVVSTERHHIPDEPGVIPYEPPSTINQASLYSSIYRNYIDSRDYPPSRSQSPYYASEYLPTPPLELATNPTLESSATPVIDAFPFPRGHHNYSTSEPHLSSNTPGLYPPLFFPHPLSRSQRPSTPSHSTHHLINRSFPAVVSRPSSTSPPPLIHHPLAIPPEQKEFPLPRKLQAGDTLYWHHLAKTGEIPGVEDDERARGNIKPKAPGGKPSAPLSFDR